MYNFILYTLKGKCIGCATPYFPGLTLSRYHSRMRKMMQEMMWEPQMSSRGRLSDDMGVLTASQVIPADPSVSLNQIMMILN